MASAVKGLACAVSRLGQQVKVVSTCPGSGIERCRHSLRGIDSLTPREDRIAVFKQDIKRAVEWAELIHIAGVWDYSTRVAAAIARRLNKPYVMTPHGLLDPYRMKHKAIKKTVYCWLVGRRDYSHAAAVQALVQSEASWLRCWGYKGPLLYLPNGVDIQQKSNLIDSEKFYEICPSARNKRIILYLSRIDPEKGAKELIGAAGPVLTESGNAVLVMAGNANNVKFASRLKTCTREGKYKEVIAFPGFLDGEAKQAALQEAKVFILPSFSEGFSMSLLEAMANRCACIVTPYCNFPEIPSKQAGVCVKPTVHALQKAISCILRASDNELERMGQNARRIIETRYTWEAVAEKMIRAYQSVLNGRYKDCEY